MICPVLEPLEKGTDDDQAEVLQGYGRCGLKRRFGGHRADHHRSGQLMRYEKRSSLRVSNSVQCRIEALQQDVVHTLLEVASVPLPLSRIFVLDNRFYRESGRTAEPHGELHRPATRRI